MASEPRNGVPPTSECIRLPGRIDTKSAQAHFTPAGQLYVRINAAPA